MTTRYTNSDGSRTVNWNGCHVCILKDSPDCDGIENCDGPVKEPIRGKILYVNSQNPFPNKMRKASL